ncbi:hypothetical protein MJH12_14530 [bacterium]|nr:hypothetical protein [bacterium]
MTYFHFYWDLFLQFSLPKIRFHAVFIYLMLAMPQQISASTPIVINDLKAGWHNIAGNDQDISSFLSTLSVFFLLLIINRVFLLNGFQTDSIELLGEY